MRSGTLFHASKLPLSKWFQAIYLVTQNKSNISALALKRYLGVCYRTAWRVKHKLLEAMAERESRRLLTGVVVADDAYLGGVHAGKPGRGSENKVPFMAAVELNDAGHPLHVRFDPIADLKGSTLACWARTALHEAVHLVTDGLASFSAAGAVVAAHGAIIVNPRQSSDLEVFEWVNTFIANLKTPIRGTYHHFDFKRVRGSLPRRGAVSRQPPLRAALAGRSTAVDLRQNRTLFGILAARRRRLRGRPWRSARPDDAGSPCRHIVLWR